MTNKTASTVGRWNWSWAQFTGATAGGAIGGSVAFAFGLELLLTAFITGFATNLISMNLQNSWEGKHYSAMQIFGTSFMIGALAAITAGLMDKIKIPGLNTGRGSYTAIYKQISTKFWNGTINRISGESFAKMLTLNLYGSMFGSGVDSLVERYNINERMAEKWDWIEYRGWEKKLTIW